jgi:hypothetical protein
MREIEAAAFDLANMAALREHVFVASNHVRIPQNRKNDNFRIFSRVPPLLTHALWYHQFEKLSGSAVIVFTGSAYIN